MLYFLNNFVTFKNTENVFQYLLVYEIYISQSLYQIYKQKAEWKMSSQDN